MTNYKIHVISNTHWDREWLFNFQETRMQLVEFLDGLVETMEQHPDYRSFVLDSQSVPIEDYLEVRPEMREGIENLVKSKRLLIGPWYTCPEGFEVNGESLIRNLLVGHRVARSYGHVMKVGHTPFSYGQNSQMPQIYSGFGIKTMLFYHGVSQDQVPNEWIFEGADGTRILGSQMSSGARYNYYHGVYRPAVTGKTISEREYTWKEGGLPFHRATSEQALSHYALLEPVLKLDRERLRRSLLALRDAEIKVVTTRHLAFMMGHDSSIADPIEMEMIEAAKELLDGQEIVHGHYEEMIDAIYKEVPWDKLVVLRGERRVPKPMPIILHLYSDVLSSRTRMKYRSSLAEYLLQTRVEPFGVVAALNGAAHPGVLLDLAWKTMLRCHAHDSISGSGVDAIEEDVMNRLRQVLDIGQGLYTRSLAHIQRQVDTSHLADDAIVLTTYNPRPRKGREVVEGVVDLPWEGPRPRSQFCIRDVVTNEIIPMQCAARKPQWVIVNHAADATAMMQTERFKIYFEAESVPGLGYASYYVDRDGSFTTGSLVTGFNTMENEWLRAVIRNDGTISLTDKERGTVYDDLHYFVDDGEAGHAWMHLRPAQDAAIDSRGFPVRIALVEDGPLLARYQIDYEMRVPSGLNENGGDPWQRLDGVGNQASRGSIEKPMIISSVVTLKKGARSLEVTTHFTNEAECHRLRLVLPTRRQGTSCHAESAFDVVVRETVFDEDSVWHGAKGVTFPMQRFVDVSDGDSGLAFISAGLREYEVTDDAERSIAVTLLRAYEVQLTTVSHRWEEQPQMKLAQSPGYHEFSYRIYPHGGTFEEGGVLLEAEGHVTPFELVQAGVSRGSLPPRHGYLDIQPEAVQMAAFKRSDADDGWILRLFNPTDKSVDACITLPSSFVRAQQVSLEEIAGAEVIIREGLLRLEIPAKKIVTLHLAE
ncbi:MAG: hypothetical protein GX117_11495 [Candidatus Hydrogenedentes bacterium]|jgi:mannosylglycerate hydrolase|nr:hypothetical protein [Candidatus Hydrogenedentota bacterium]